MHIAITPMSIMDIPEIKRIALINCIVLGIRSKDNGGEDWQLPVLHGDREIIITPWEIPFAICNVRQSNTTFRSKRISFSGGR